MLEMYLTKIVCIVIIKTVSFNLDRINISAKEALAAKRQTYRGSVFL